MFLPILPLVPERLCSSNACYMLVNCLMLQGQDLRQWSLKAFCERFPNSNYKSSTYFGAGQFPGMHISPPHYSFSILHTLPHSSRKRKKGMRVSARDILW